MAVSGVTGSGSGSNNNYSYTVKEENGNLYRVTVSNGRTTRSLISSGNTSSSSSSSSSSTSGTSSPAYDATGIDKDGIPKMISAINTYQEKVKNAITNLTSVSNDTTIMNNAMKGKGVQEQYKNAEINIMEKARRVLEQLSAFQSALDKQVFQAYESTSVERAKGSFNIK